MLSRQPHSSSTVRITVLTPITTSQPSSSPSPASSSSSSQSPEAESAPLTVRTRPKSRTNSDCPRHRHAHTRTRSYSGSMPLASSFSFSQASSSSSTLPPGQGPRAPGPASGSPPPYSPDPPEAATNSPFLAKRAVSTPHLQSPPLSTAALHVYPHSHTTSRRASSTALHAQSPVRQRTTRALETDDDADACTSGDDAVEYKSTQVISAGSLRERLFGKGKGRADAIERLRMISTTPGVLGAGETETESEEGPRNLPTARFTAGSSLSPHSPLSATMIIPIPSSDPSQRHRTTIDLAPFLFESCRLLSVVPAVFGTMWNAYHVLRPPNDELTWALEYAVCVIWSALTGWQCLQLTTGLLKRWRVYYSPLPTLIRLLALQAICWPATHFTLTILSHEIRPLVCWAAIGTTTFCSRSIQMWVTSNIVEPPGATADANMKRRSRRKWDWVAVLRECILPAGIAYFVMAWMVVLRREFWGC